MNDELDPLAFGVIGLGRVGGAVARALHLAGHPAVGVSVHGQIDQDRVDALVPGIALLEPAEVAEKAGLVWLTVPDDLIEPLCLELSSYWHPGQVVIHTCGAKGVAALAPASARGAIALAIHPVMTFSGTSLDVSRMNGAPFAITTPRGMEPLAQALVHELGGVAFIVREDDRSLYHVALCHLSNHMVTLVGQARTLLQAATLEDPSEVLTPLAKASLDGALRAGIGALTGPISRGDVTTVVRQREALVNYAATRGALVDGQMALDQAGAAALDAVHTYLELARMTARAAQRSGQIDQAVLQRLEAALGDQTNTTSADQDSRE